MPKIQNLEKWFDRLVRNEMHGPALATAGIAVGLVIMTAGVFPWGRPTQDIVMVVGLALGCIIISPFRRVRSLAAL
jgi:hypothetical protein